MNLIDFRYLLTGKCNYDKFKNEFEKFFTKFCEDIATRITFMSLEHNPEYIDKQISDFIIRIISEYGSSTTMAEIEKEVRHFNIIDVDQDEELIKQSKMTAREFLLSMSEDELTAFGLTKDDLTTYEEKYQTTNNKIDFINFAIEYRSKVSNMRDEVSNKHHQQNIGKYREQIKDVLIGGRRFRPTLVFLGYLLADKRINEQMLVASSVIEFMHKYSLVLDDLYDNDDYRRGQITFHKKYNVEEAKEMISYLRSIFRYNLMNPAVCAFDMPLNEYNVSDIFYPISIWQDTFDIWENAHEGFYAEIKGRKESKLLTTNQVIEIERKQTSFIIKNALVIGYSLGAKDNINDVYKNVLDVIGDKAGVIFQVINDLEIFLSDEYQIGNKGKLYSDLESGAKNYVASLIPEKLASIMTVEEKVDYIKNKGLIIQTIQFLNSEFDTCINLVKKLPYSETRSLLLVYIKHEWKELTEKLDQKGYNRSDKALGKSYKKKKN